MARIRAIMATGGGALNPQLTTKSTYNTNFNNQPLSGLTVGKTYAIVYHTNNTASTSVTGGDIIGEVFQSNGANWSAVIIDRLFFIKATSTSITLTNGSGSLYGVLIVQID